MRVLKRKICLFQIKLDEVLLNNINYYQIPINLISSYQNVGMQSDLVTDWVGGKHYSNQMYTLYNDKLYNLNESISTYGNFDECNKEFSFDNENWTKIDFKGNSVDVQISAIAESRLAEFKLACSTDNMGNALHGIIEGDYTDYINSNKKMLLPYKAMTVVNVTDTDVSYMINGEKKYYMFGNILTNIGDNEDAVTFVYYIGAIMKLVNEKYEIQNEDVAIKYTETYKKIAKVENFYINDKAWFEIQYYDLEPLNAITTTIVNTNTKVTTPIANITYKDVATYNNNQSINSGIVLDENVGIAYPTKINNTIIISRGGSNYFERHLILSNIKTFEALEQYSNGFMKIIDNNNL